MVSPNRGRPSAQCLSVTAVNIRRLDDTTRVQTIEFLDEHKPSILALSETHLVHTHLKHNEYVHYDLSQPMIRSVFHGISTSQTILIRKDIGHEHLTDYCHISPQYSLNWLRVQVPHALQSSLGDNHILIGSIYRSPTPGLPHQLTPQAVWKHIAANIHRVRTAFPTAGLLLAGDFNARLLECGDAKGKHTTHDIYQSLLNPLQLQVVNSTLAHGIYTRFTPGASRGSILDLAIVDARTMSACESMTVGPDIFDSDHLPITVNLCSGTGAVPHNTAPHKRFKVAQLDRPLFQQIMHDMFESVADQFHQLLQQSSREAMDSALSLVHDCYSDSAVGACPRTMVRPGQNPYWGLIKDRDRLQRELRHALRRYKRQRTGRAAVVTARYAAKQAWKSAIAEAKAAAHEMFVSQLDGSPTAMDAAMQPSTEAVQNTSLNRRLYWSYYKRTKPSEFGAPMVKKGTRLPSSPQEGIENMAAAFAAISQAVPDSTAYHAHVTAAIPTMEHEFRCNTQYTERDSMPYTFEQLDEMFSTLPVSAAGDDCIHVEFLRASTANVRRAIYQLNSRCWDLGILPTAYTRAKVVPLYKTAQAGPRDEANSYRPISITTLLIRTHERLLLPYYKAHILPRVTAYQHGFRPGQSTQDSIHRVVEMIYRTISAKKDNYSAVLSIDLAKAFDTVWVDGLLYTLRKRMGITGRAWLFIQSFLTNRTFHVVGDNMESIPQRIYAGVPQGSVLGPLLFLAFIDRLAWHVSPHATMALYADDANVWPRQLGLAGIRQLRTAASIITRWTRQHKLRINTDKSKLLAVSNKIRDRVSLPRSHWRAIQLAGKVVQYTDALDVLGITVQGTGRWVYQSEQMIARARSLAHTMGRLCSRTTTGPPQPISIYTVTKAVLLSTILYGLHLWRPSRTTLDKLDSALSWPLRYALCNKARSVSILGTLADFAIPPLRVLRAGQLLAFQHRLESAKSLRTLDHLSRTSMRRQRQRFLATPLPGALGKRTSKQAVFVRSIAQETEEVAAKVLALPVDSAIHPRTWTPQVLQPAMSQAAWTQLMTEPTGRKALTLTRVFQPRHLTGDPLTYIQPRPQLYLSHELKPHSVERARLRLDTADTPYMLFVQGRRSSARCLYCQSRRADRLHLLMHCVRYAPLRAAIRRKCYLWGIPSQEQDLYLFLGTMPTTEPPLAKRRCLALLRSTGRLIHAISEDLPDPHNPISRYDQPP
jgi:hypothetical protein